MAKPTLQASLQGAQLIKQALIKQNLSQKELADRLGIHRSVISALLNGKPILSENFHQIGSMLGFEQNWYALTISEEIANQDLTESNHENDFELTSLVQEVRSKLRDIIQEWCGTMRVLDMSQPVEMSRIYTDVNVLEKLSAHRRKTIKEFLAESNLEDLEKFGLGRITEKRVPGESAVVKYKKLILLGKPGSGKTTFVKYLAIQCNKGTFMQNLVPIFLNLKYFSESPNSPSILEYMGQLFYDFGVTLEHIKALFIKKSVLVLLDGLDEVKKEHYERTLSEIRSLSRIYYDNYFIITCRIAAQEYSYDVFDKFTEVELADFDEKQIETFISQWFETKKVNFIKAEEVVKTLRNNYRLSQLAVTPLLLTLICLVFEEKCNPPNNRSELYIEGIEILLSKWDAKRGIQREQVYQQLSIQKKKDLLSYLAFETFKDKEFFFDQRKAKDYITEYIQNLRSNADKDKESLEVDSETILHAIEAQHGLLVERAKGVYSFSHLTFHEYFTAREINIRKHPRTKAFEDLVNNLSNRYWREVFLLSAEMAQPDASLLFQLIKEKVDKMLENNEKLQSFLDYVRKMSLTLKKSLIHSDSIKLSAIRAFCFDIDFEIDQERKLTLLLDRLANYLVCGSFFARVFKDTDFKEGIIIAECYDKDIAEGERKICDASSADQAMYIAIEYALKSKKTRQEIKDVLDDLYQKDPQSDYNKLDEEDLKCLADKSRTLAKETRQIRDHSWQFNDEEKNLLKAYYENNLLLVECLNTDCIIDPKVRQEILDTLILPIDNQKVNLS